MGGSSTTNSAPWSGQQPYMNAANRAASQMFGVNPATGSYPGYRPDNPSSRAPNSYVPASTDTGFMGIGIVPWDSGGMTGPNYSGFSDTGQVYGPSNQAAFGRAWNQQQGQTGQPQPASLMGQMAARGPGGGYAPSPGGVQGQASPGYGSPGQYGGPQGGSPPYGYPSPPGGQYGSQIANQMAAMGPQYYPNSTVAQFAPQQQAAIDMTTGLAMQGDPATNASRAGLAGTMGGQYLDPSSNPYLQGTYQQAANQVQKGVGSMFEQAGRYGSTADQNTMGQQLGNLATNIYGGAYGQERQNMMSAYGMAPGQQAADYSNLQNLFGAGQQVQGLQQQNIQDAMNRYNYYQNLPYQQLANFSQMIAGNGYGGTSATQQNPGALGILQAVLG